MLLFSFLMCVKDLINLYFPFVLCGTSFFCLIYIQGCYCKIMFLFRFLHSLVEEVSYFTCFV